MLIKKKNSAKAASFAVTDAWLWEERNRQCIWFQVNNTVCVTHLEPRSEDKTQDTKTQDRNCRPFTLSTTMSKTKIPKG